MMQAITAVYPCKESNTPSFFLRRLGPNGCLLAIFDYGWAGAPGTEAGLLDSLGTATLHQPDDLEKLLAVDGLPASTNAGLALVMGENLYVTHVGCGPHIYLFRCDSPILEFVPPSDSLHTPQVFHQSAVTLKTGDVLVLATSGIIANIPPEKFPALILNDAGTPYDAANRLAELLGIMATYDFNFCGSQSNPPPFRMGDCKAIIHFYDSSRLDIRPGTLHRPMAHSAIPWTKSLSQ